MDIGIGTYALLWEWHERNPHPLSLPAQLDLAAELQCDVFQICDYPAIEAMSESELTAIRTHAAGLGLRLELGTRGIGPNHIGRYLQIAEILEATTLRSMIQASDVAQGPEQAISALRCVLTQLQQSGVTLALETYEQVPTLTLVHIVDALDSPLIGICLDPANCVSALEHPNDVVRSTAHRVANLHVKDFRFDRQAGWIGFTLNGARMGEGLLDLTYELDRVYRDGRFPSAIVEHWLPWQGDLETTLAIEREWTRTTLSALRDYRANHPNLHKGDPE